MTLRLAIAAACIVACWAAAPAASAQNANCTAIRSDFESNARPRFLRIVKRYPSVAMVFQKHLNAVKQDDNPTRADIESAYKLLVQTCNTRTDTQVCLSYAQNLRSAARENFDINRRWARAGCPGTLAAR